MEKNPKGTFVNLVDFPPIRPGKEAEFLEWFRWTNELYAKHKGFISRTLLKPTEGKPELRCYSGACLEGDLYGYAFEQGPRGGF